MSTPPSVMRELWAPGGQVGPWTLIALVARGGMADVFEAHGDERGRVALKILRTPDDPAHIGFIEQRFAKEVAALVRLQHPGIVRAVGHGRTSAGTPWLATEWVGGRDLGTIYREEQPRPERVLRIIAQVARAAAHAHANGVVHRDLKSGNIRVGEENRVTVLDFGLATVDEHEAQVEGRILGSAHSIAPEQVSGAPVDHRVDIYGIGVLLYRGLVGRYPFHGRQPAEILAAHVHRDVPPFSRYRPDLQLPDGLEDTVRRCLAKRPEERFPDAEMLTVTLEAYIERLESQTLWTPPRRYRWWLWCGVGVLAGAVAALARWLA